MMMNPPESMDGQYNGFYDAVSENSIFNKKTTVLLKLAASTVRVFFHSVTIGIFAWFVI